jgi:hypothetical protein
MTTNTAAPPSAPSSHTSSTRLRGPLFGGYTVVAIVAAWLVGIALRASDTRGLEDAAGRFNVAQAADAGMLHPTSEYIAWLDAIRHGGARRAQIRQGDTLWLDQQSRVRVLAPPQELYPDTSDTTTATNDVILRLETPGLRALLLGAADDLALDALAGSGQSLAADVVAVALPPGTPIDSQGPLGTVLKMSHPRLVVVTNTPGGTGAQTALRNASTLAPDDEEAAIR